MRTESCYKCHWFHYDGSRIYGNGDKLTAIAQEEMEHFSQVHKIIKKRGGVLGKTRKDDYVNDLYKFIIQGSRQDYLIDRMLFAAMIEARSCERFKVLTENIKDEELKKSITI